MTQTCDRKHFTVLEMAADCWRTNDSVVHYAAIYCPSQRTSGSQCSQQTYHCLS